jgi:NDP-sugar pyrophosphorylase family protein
MIDIHQAVILAGRSGMRLLPHSAFLNKGMITVLGKQFLRYIVEQFARQGIKKILFLTGHLFETIQVYFYDGSKFCLEICYSFNQRIQIMEKE